MKHISYDHQTMRRKYLLPALQSAGLLIAFTVVDPALAQTMPPANISDKPNPDPAAGASSIPDIVVTAERRSQRLQDVPISITALSQSALTSVGIANVDQLPQLTAGLVTPVSLTGGVALSPFIRGIGTPTAIAGFETSVAVYVDGVYSAAEDESGLDIDLANIERVEVLKGPQGTLYGRNATGGAINIITKRPSDEFGGDASFSYGSYDETVEKGYLTGPIASNLSASLSAVARQGGNYGRNVFLGSGIGGVNSVTTNAQLAWTPTARLHVDASFSYGQSRQKGVDINTVVPVGTVPPGGVAGGLYSTNPNISEADADQMLYRHKYSASLHAKYSLDGVDLTSISAYQQGTAHNIFDADGTSSPIEAINFQVPSHEFTQELQAASSGTHRFQWIAGAYFISFHEQYRPFEIDVAPLNIAFHSNAVATGGSVFGQGTYAITDNTKITGGIRYSVEKKSLGLTLEAPTLGNAALAGPNFFSKTYRDPSWRASIEQKFGPNINSYVSYNRGFKSGGFNSLSADPNLRGVKPEILDAYEAGVKSQFADRKIQINAAVYYYNYRDIQVQSVTLGGQTAAVLENAASAKLYGLDTDLIVIPTPQLRLNAGINLEHSRYGSFPDASGLIVSNGAGVAASFDETGKQTLGAPNVTYNVGGNYRVPLHEHGHFFVSANYSYNSSYNIAPGEGNYVRAYGILNASVGWTDQSERLKVEVWGRNLTDERISGEYTTAALSALSILRPGSVGVTLSGKF